MPTLRISKTRLWSIIRELSGKGSFRSPPSENFSIFSQKYIRGGCELKEKNVVAYYLHSHFVYIILRYSIDDVVLISVHYTFISILKELKMQLKDTNENACRYIRSWGEAFQTDGLTYFRIPRVNPGKTTLNLWFINARAWDRKQKMH